MLRTALVLMLAAAAPAAAATYTASFTGVVAYTVFNDFVFGGTLLRTGYLELSPTVPAMLPISFADGDQLDFDVTLDGVFTVPATPGNQFAGFNLSFIDDPDDLLGASNTGSIRFFLGGSQVLELGAGCGNCVSAITYQGGAAAFSFDRLEGSTSFTLNRPFEALGASISFQVDGVPEPASWALMILGFGMVGGALRTRRAPLSA